MEIKVYSNNIQIVDSYKCSKYSFNDIINDIKKSNPNHPVTINRSNKSIKKEWATHNFLYNLNIARNRTKDLDINYPLSRIEKIAYGLFGWFAWIFIR